MFIGHLPAGYLIVEPMLDRAGAGAESRRALLRLGLAASVLPDLDLLWFYLVDDRRQVHHAYLPHLPGFWLGVFAAAVLLLLAIRARRSAWLALGVAAIGILSHLLLDTVAGGIRWLWPASDVELALVEVTARYQPWYLNFVLHWTFALELGLVLAAWWMWRHRSRTSALPSSRRDAASSSRS